MDPLIRKLSIAIGAGILFLLAVGIASIEYLSHTAKQGHYPFLISPPHGLEYRHPYSALGPIMVSREYLDVLREVTRGNSWYRPDGVDPQVMFETYAKQHGWDEFRGVFVIRSFYSWVPVDANTVVWLTMLTSVEKPDEELWTLIFEKNKWPAKYERNDDRP